MKTTSLKTIYLTADELKQAIVEYLAKEHEELAQHLYDSECDMVWSQGGKDFLVSIDGEIEEQIERLKKTAEQKEINKVVDQVKSAAIKASHKVIEDHKETLQKLADTPSAICDACGERTHEFETASTETLSGVVMCSGKAKERCKEIATSRINEQVVRLRSKTTWYNCAKCDAGYMDQECTCDNNQEGKE